MLSQQEIRIVSTRHLSAMNGFWEIETADPTAIARLISEVGISEIVARLLLSYGIKTAAEATDFLHPQLTRPPSVAAEFGQPFTKAMDLLLATVRRRSLICVTSSVLHADGVMAACALMRAIRQLGGRGFFIAPDVDKDGYGVGSQVIRRCHEFGSDLLIIVNDGINACEALEEARRLKIATVVCDHHKLDAASPLLATVTLNPALNLKPDSFYSYLSGAGIAYALAYLALRELECLTPEISAVLLELFTLNTLADEVPLLKSNRRALQRGLSSLTQPRLPALQAMKEALLSVKMDAVMTGLQVKLLLVDRLISVSRSGQSDLLVEFLTTDNLAHARALVETVEGLDSERWVKGDQAYQQAVSFLDKLNFDPRHSGFICLVNVNWLYVTDIIAERLAKEYCCSTFIGAENGTGIITGTARLSESLDGSKMFDIFSQCNFLLGYSADSRKGAFSLKSRDFNAFFASLEAFFRAQPPPLTAPMSVKAVLRLEDCSLQLHAQLQSLEPLDRLPVFVVSNVRVVDQSQVQGHLKLLVVDGENPSHVIRVMGWRMASHHPVPEVCNLAVSLNCETFDGIKSVFLNLLNYAAVPSID